MAIKIELDSNGNVPSKCMELLVNLANHRDCCVTCVIAHTQKLPFEDYCLKGQRLIREFLEQPEVKNA